ncbi:hypothetical protein [Mucilaginibacter aquariorum]|nr:hypothetical protein [Mucilaginibacter aquariorum]
MQIGYAKFANRSFAIAQDDKLKRDDGDLQDSFFSSPSAKQLRAKAGRTWWACAWQGHRKFCRSEGQERAKWGKRFQPVVLPGLQGKGPVRQRSLFADLIFCYFLIKQYGEALLSTLKKQTTTKNVKAFRGE